jgi:hypothetical protein
VACEFCPTDDGDCGVCDRHAAGRLTSERAKVLKVQVGRERLVMFAEGGVEHQTYVAPFGWCLAALDAQPPANLAAAAREARAVVFPWLDAVTVEQLAGV